MKALLEHNTICFFRKLSILVCFFFFQNSTVPISANTVDSEFDQNNPISETYVQDEIANTVWAKVGLRRVLSKNEIGSDCEVLTGESGDAAKGGIQLTKKTFGHTFTTHGDNMTNFLINRAKGSGMAQGQFLNNQKAAQFVLDNLSKTANGTVNIPIPKSFPARVIMPNGTFTAATHIRLVPGGGGVKTAYPLIP